MCKNVAYIYSLTDLQFHFQLVREIYLVFIFLGLKIQNTIEVKYVLSSVNVLKFKRTSRRF